MYKPFAAPWRLLWPTLWWLAVLLVVALSLVPTPQGLDLPRNTDKVQHLLAYGVLAAAAVQVFRPGRVLLLVAVGLCALGVMLEFAQGAMTAYRQAEPADALANATGVLLGMATALMPSRDLLLRWSGRRG